MLTGSVTHTGLQKPSRSPPELTGALLGIAPALANAPQLVRAAGGEHSPAPTGFAPELARGKAAPRQPDAHPTTQARGEAVRDGEHLRQLPQSYPSPAGPRGFTSRDAQWSRCSAGRSAAHGEALGKSSAIPRAAGREGCCLQDTHPSTGAACNSFTGWQGSGTGRLGSKPQTVMEPSSPPGFLCAHNRAPAPGHSQQEPAIPKPPNYKRPCVTPWCCLQIWRGKPNALGWVRGTSASCCHQRCGDATAKWGAGGTGARSPWSRARRKRQQLLPKGTLTAWSRAVPTAAETMNPQVPSEKKPRGSRAGTGPPVLPEGEPGVLGDAGSRLGSPGSQGLGPIRSPGSSGCCSRGG